MDLLKSTQITLQDVFARSIWNKEIDQPNHCVILLGHGAKSGAKTLLSARIAAWQIESIKNKPCMSFTTETSGIVWLLRPNQIEKENGFSGHNQRLKSSHFGRTRDLVGEFWRTEKMTDAKVQFYFVDCNEDEILAALVGMGLAHYNFVDVIKNEVKENEVGFKSNKGPIRESTIQKAKALIQGMNLARHWANLPAEVANAEALASGVQSLFKNHKAVKVTVWDDKEVAKNKMGLLSAVGRGSVHGARLVHLRYRPAGIPLRRQKPIAFVGKGVIFDTGGLDIKSAGGMRWMKKDMSGAAIVTGLCYMASTLKLKIAADFYLPLAENCVSEKSYHPGDVVQARNGQWVEIDNTDAEGRLVMADAIDLAVSQKEADQPVALYDVSTLTGAMRVALGLEVAGFFSTDDKLAKQVEISAQKMGELAWRMPLIQKFDRQLKSNFADFKNSSDSGFGGAITAALFLHKFIRDVPWVHFDAMVWNNSADGAMSEGSNAQCFQILAGLLLDSMLSA